MQPTAAAAAAAASSTGATHRKAGTALRPHHVPHRTVDEGEELLSSLGFLQRMACVFEEQGNYAECVKSVESALLLRQTHAAAVDRAIAQRQRALADPNARRRGAPVPRAAPADANGAFVSLTEDGDVVLPVKISMQAREVVLRCNSYAVEALQHSQFDGAAFFLNRAMFLTDGDGDAQPDNSVTRDGTAAATAAAAAAATGAASGQWWWRSVLQASGPPQPGSPCAAAGDSAEVDALSHTQKEMKSATAATATALRACFEPTPHDQQLRLSLRAATLNHLGCLEQRRGRLHASVVFLRMAIETQSQLDESRRIAGDAVAQAAAMSDAGDGGGGSSSSNTTSITSTYLNLCTVLNELGQHAEAAQVCERVLPLLQQALLSCTSARTTATAETPADMLSQQARQQEARLAQARTATMLAVAYYSLGASLERRDAAGGNKDAQRWAFREAVHVCHHYRLVPPSCVTIDEVMLALRHPGAAPATVEEERAASAAPETRGTPADASAAAAALRPVPPPMNPSSWSATPPGARTTDVARLHPQLPPPTQAGPKRPSPPPSITTYPAPAGTTATAAAAATAAAPATAAAAPAPPAAAAPAVTPAPPPPRSRPQSGNASTRPPLPPLLEPLPHGSVDLAATAPPRPSMLMPQPPALPPMQRRSLPFGASGTTAPAPPALPGMANPRASLVAATTGALPRNSLRASLTSGNGGAAAAAAAAAAAPNAPRAGRLQGAVGDRQRTLQNAKNQKSKRQKSLVRRQQLEAAVADAALAERVFHQLVSDKEKTEVERCRRAAVQIQRMWRGVLARKWVTTLITAAVQLQRVVRRFLVRARVRHALEAEERARRQAEESARQEAACRILQARARQFLRRLQVRREYRARQARQYYAARTIQRGYRAFCERRAAFLAARAEAHRREDEQREFRRKVAARRIQRAYLEYRTKRAELDEHRARQRRIRAAVHIQAVVRGYLTRAWYAYYRVYRRDQEVRSAAMQSRLVLIQSACRAICSAYYGQQRALRALLTMREARRHVAATQLQCLWRCHVAKIHLARLRAEHDRLVRQATRIQRWYRMRVERRAFLAYRAEQQRIRAVSRLQRWLRSCWQAAKAREFAAYHAELLRHQQLQRLQARAVVLLQAGCAACLSDRLVGSVRRTFQRDDTVARVWQRAGRGFAARREMALERRAAYWVAVREREEARRRAAACVLQRAWRCAAAKDTVERMRREVAAADVVTRAYRVYRARAQLAELRSERRRRVEDAAARRIQRALRGFLHRKRAKEMDAYYRGEHQRKMWRLRRQEAAVMIQSLWRGHVTRRVVEQERAQWMVLSTAAARIQRAWRSRRSRQLLHRKLSERIKERARDAEAAVVVQCMWRKVMAVRSAARLRVQRQRRLAAVVQIQMWWRVRLAEREFARRRVIRREEAALELYYAMQWETHVSLVNAFVRTRGAQVRVRDTQRDRLVAQLTEAARHRFASRHAAATKIQATYRGHYERVYVRGLVAQAREEARVVAELAARQQRAAVVIQCAYRCCKARQQLADLKQAELERVLVSHQEFAEKADPAEVVRELFWLHTTYQQREAGNARRREAERRRGAAAIIQRAYRCWKSRQQVAMAAELHQRERAARLLQDHWRHYRDNHRIKERQRRQAAATQLQSHIRGWLVRRSWPLWRAAVEAERQEHVLVQDMLDHAAMVIQCMWRRVQAQRTAARLRQAHQARHRARARQEAATVIQDAFRGYQRRRLARTL
ncbi:IQ calmodulin-binding motif containing protein [Novymonas esmeraldas]|uniref:IQ calmodulin-binding motif containing protein n=1 Tax=Novymonas esmeraldas TaxID=1808958 RepID=A0AAW0EN60_9TRYP